MSKPMNGSEPRKAVLRTPLRLRTEARGAGFRQTAHLRDIGTKIASVCSWMVPAGVLVLSSCRSDTPRVVRTATVQPAPTVLDDSRPWATTEDLAEGRRLHDLKCGTCHAPYGRTGYAPRQWESIMGRMGPKSGLDTAQQRRVLDWLVLGDSLPIRNDR